MGRHNKLHVQNYRRRQKLLKKAKRKQDSSSFPSISTPGEDSSKSISEQFSREVSDQPNVAAPKPQKIGVLTRIHNDPLYIRMKEYSLLKERLAAITQGH